MSPVAGTHASLRSMCHGAGRGAARTSTLSPTWRSSSATGACARGAHACVRGLACRSVAPCTAVPIVTGTPVCAHGSCAMASAAAHAKGWPAPMQLGLGLSGACTVLAGAREPPLLTSLACAPVPVVGVLLARPWKPPHHMRPCLHAVESLFLRLHRPLRLACSLDPT